MDIIKLPPDERSVFSSLEHKNYKLTIRGRGMSSVSERLCMYTPDFSPLPAFHNTDLSGLHEIIESKEINPRPAAFPQHVFLASGRPYFMRPSKKSRVKPTPRGRIHISDEEITSISFIIPSYPSPIFAAPFDSGRFLKSQFDSDADYKCIPPLGRLTRGEFLVNEMQINSTQASPRHHVAAMFGSNENFLSMRSRSDVCETDNPQNGFEYMSTLVVRSSRKEKSRGFDLSAQTCELQVRTIDCGNLGESTVFAPARLMSKYKDLFDDLRKIVKDVRPYVVIGATPVDYLQGLVVAARLWIENSYLSEGV